MYDSSMPPKVILCIYFKTTLITLMFDIFMNRMKNLVLDNTENDYVLSLQIGDSKISCLKEALSVRQFICVCVRQFTPSV